MTCNCIHNNSDLVFPVFGPAPMGPATNWPEYFVPSINELGYGHYHCPRCKDGVDEARAKLGFVKEPEPPVVWWKRVIQLFRSLDAEERDRNSSAIHSR